MPERKSKRAVVQPPSAKSLHAVRTTGSCIEPPSGPHGWHTITPTGEPCTSSRAFTPPLMRAKTSSGSLMLAFVVRTVLASPV